MAPARHLWFTARIDGTSSSPSRAGLVVRLRPLHIERALAAVLAVLAIGHLVTTVVHSSSLDVLNADIESSIPTWWNSILFLLAAVAAAAVSAHPDTQTRWRWRILGLVLLAFSLEEVAAVHERAAANASDRLDLPGTISTSIVVFGAILFPFVVFGLVVLARGLHGPARLRVLGGIAIWYLAAFGIEAVEAAAFSVSHSDRADRIISGTQEVLEMGGITILLVGLLQLLEGRTPVVVEVGERPALQRSELGPTDGGADTVTVGAVSVAESVVPQPL